MCQLPCQTATCSRWHHEPIGDVLGHTKQTFHWKWVNPPRSGSTKAPLMERPLLLWCKTLINHHPIFSPWWGLCIHLVGSSSPWRSELIISPCVPIQHGTCPLGMILHINSYALHGLISHRVHSNVNHISSSILLNICIKTLIHQSIAQRHYKKPAIQDWRKRQDVLLG